MKLQSKYIIKSLYTHLWNSEARYCAKVSVKCVPPMLLSVFVERTRYIPLLTSMTLIDKDVPPSLNTKMLLKKKDNMSKLWENHSIVKPGSTS